MSRPLSEVGLHFTTQALHPLQGARCSSTAGCSLPSIVHCRALTAWLWCANSAAISAIGLRTLDLSCLYTGGGSHGIEFATDHVRSIGVWERLKYFITYRHYMDYSSYMETTIFRTAAMLGFRRLQSYMLPCLYALLILP